MMEGEYNAWEHVTVGNFLDQRGYERRPFEDNIARVMGVYLGCNPQDAQQVREQTVFGLLSSSRYRAFAEAFEGKPIDPVVMDYVRGHVDGVRARSRMLQ